MSRIEADVLRELLRYEPDTGEFHWVVRGREHFQSVHQWRNWNGRYPGTRAGRLTPKGYRAIAVMDRLYAAHRLAWLYVHGAWPGGQIDHINGDRDDNRIANLRDVPGGENAKNRRLTASSKTGRIGVTEYPFKGVMKYAARIRVDGRLHHLGYFDSVDGAAAARAEAEARFGFHENHGAPPVRRLQGRPFPARNREESR